MHKFAVVDIETTGSYSAECGITEIAVLIHDGEKIIDSFETLINPGSPILPFVSRLTGITEGMVHDAPKFEEVAKRIMLMTADCIFVAHSVNFDYSFIHNAFKSLGAEFRRRKLCTIRLSRKIFPGLPSYSLGNICSHLGIETANRHRAMGDAMATVKLLEKCMANDHENIISDSLKKNSKEAVLPPNLHKAVYDGLPEKTGVYYFHDQKDKIIYIGKAVNIKKRIYSHFTGRTKPLSFLNAVANITYRLCGTELIALLLESDEIKRVYPLYNLAQKHDRGNYVLIDYVDMKNIHRIHFVKNHPSLKAITVFRSFDEARSFMFRFMEQFELCPKYCGMQTGTGCCFDYQVKKCKGVCAGKEPANKYNKRVQKALKSLDASNESKMIVGKGRDESEKSVVVVEKGVYKGFGYFDAGMDLNNLDEAKKIIHPFRFTADVQNILRRMT